MLFDGKRESLTRQNNTANSIKGGFYPAVAALAPTDLAVGTGQDLSSREQNLKNRGRVVLKVRTGRRAITSLFGGGEVLLE